MRFTCGPRLGKGGCRIWDRSKKLHRWCCTTIADLQPQDNPAILVFDSEQRLVSVQETNSVLTIPDAESTGDEPNLVKGSPSEDGNIVVQKCENGCPRLNSYLKFSYNGDGFLIDRNTEQFIVAPQGNSVNLYTPLVTTACGAGALPATLDQCPDKENAQFDLLPYLPFLLERRRSIALHIHIRTLMIFNPLLLQISGKRRGDVQKRKNAWCTCMWTQTLQTLLQRIRERRGSARHLTLCTPGNQAISWVLEH